MNKIWLIVKREYLTRVKNKTFLLSTFLFPIVMVLFIFGASFLSAKSDNKRKTVAVTDPKGFFKPILKSDSTKLLFVFDTNVDTSNYVSKGFDGLIYSDDNIGRHFILKTPKAASISFMENVEDRLNEAYLNFQLQKNGIEQSKLDSIKSNTKNYFNIDNAAGNDKKIVNAAANTGIGIFCGFLIYLTMFIFGAMVMRGVMEEKTNRIAEVVVSSVKPFQLMMGKILGVGAVGLTQLILWVILMSIASFIATQFLSPTAISQLAELKNNPTIANNPAFKAEAGVQAISTLNQLNWGLIISSFIFYFIGGFLFYSSLFAAIGSVINEDPQEAQSLMLPITMPIIFGFIILTSNINTPDSPAMVWGSIIPFTSPIIMMGRITSSPPLWQIVLSMAFLIIGFIFTTWLAGKIYRTGILMYGKKASWKEMIKWAFKS
jgi:ABC-2 type transport system permease protein